MTHFAPRALLVVVLLLLPSVGTASAEGTWVLWIETTEFEGFKTTKSWDREERIYETVDGCERALRGRIASWVEHYRSLGFAVVRDDEDGPSKFVRSGLAGSRWCGDRGLGCVIAGSTGGGNHHSFSCIPDTVDPRGAKGQ